MAPSGLVAAASAARKKPRAEGAVPSLSSSPTSAVLLRRKQKTLLLCSRGITARFRHLFKDLHKLMPHAKKESKLDTKSRLTLINEIAEMDNATNAVFFEARKRQDLYMWFAKTPSGPSMKTYVQNIHTMAELNMTGNCLRGSRPLLSFDQTFDGDAHWRLVKEMFIQILGTPNQHPKSKPFFDHMFSFSVADNKVWFRCFQITETVNDAGVKEPALVEIGPRFVLTIVRIFGGSFGGPTLYENEQYVSPNETRRHVRLLKSGSYARREMAEVKREERKKTHVLPATPLDDVFSA